MVLRLRSPPRSCLRGPEDLEVVRLLCEVGADLDEAVKNGATALMLASSSRHLEVVRLLCERADLDEAVTNGTTALMHASSS
jgi:ankyrin repeat protein